MSIIIGILLILIPAAAHATVHHRHKIKHGAPVDATASYADIVIEAETGRIIHATNADSPRHPASLTKMMTLYVTFEALESGRLRLDQYLLVSANAAEQSPSKLGLRAGQRIRVEDAILGLVTESANDAAVVIAEGLGGSEENFGRLMTHQAHELGMSNTRFDNPSGLPDPEQVTTARDMAMLGHALIYHFPQFYPYFSRDSFTYAGVYHHNHNHLMDRYSGMDGIKTGYIRASGFNLVGSAKRGNIRLIGVVFGGRSATSRDNRMAQLLDESFAEIRGGQRVATINGLAQGDSDEDNEGDEYVKLPGKIDADFEPGDEEPQAIPVAAVSPGSAASARRVNRSTGGWGIQIGAYSDPQVGRASLTKVVNAMPQLLRRADPVMEKVSMGGEDMYRARLTGLDQRSAQAACNWLVHHGQSCMAVQP